jgi:hypothetical protein
MKQFALLSQPIDVILTVHANNMGVESFVNDLHHVKSYPLSSRASHLHMHNLVNTYGIKALESFVTDVLKRKVA